MLWVGEERREHAEIRAVMITLRQAYSGSTGEGIRRPSVTAAIDLGDKNLNGVIGKLRQSPFVTRGRCPNAWGP